MTRAPVPRLIAVLLAAIAPPLPAQTGTIDQDPVGELRKLEAIFGLIRGRNARDYAVTGPNPIEEGRFVTIGGIEQWITVRGEDRANPVLLLLHGGPGDATNPWGYAGLRSWLARFTVVQWDQRGSGRTYGRHGAAIGPTISVDRLVRDGVELADSLRRILGQDKILLVGHSWGSILGVLMAKARPELFHAFVGTGQVADPARNYAVAHRELVARATRAGNREALRELAGIGPPPYPDGRGSAVQRKWANRFEGADRFIGSMLGLALAAPGYSLRDVNDWLEGQVLSGERLVPETSRLDPAALGGALAIPVFVIQGAEDYTTPTSLAREYVAALSAPRKAFVTIDGGHFAAFAKPDTFLAELSTLVGPVIR